MRRLIAFLILSLVKIFSQIFFPGTFTWMTKHPSPPFKGVRLMVVMNHTSLWEPIFLQALSFSYLWHLAATLNAPGADVTLQRPIVGAFYKLMIPNIAPVSRKKDASWDNYLNNISPNCVVMIAPEGRMKRPNGLDKFGKKMDVKGGVADIILAMNSGGMVLCLSGGLHHIQVPGQTIPKIFKRIKMNLAYYDIQEYKAQFSGQARELKMQIVQDLQHKLENDCPKET